MYSALQKIPVFGTKLTDTLGNKSLAGLTHAIAPYFETGLMPGLRGGDREATYSIMTNHPGKILHRESKAIACSSCRLDIL